MRMGGRLLTLLFDVFVVCFVCCVSVATLPLPLCCCCAALRVNDMSLQSSGGGGVGVPVLCPLVLRHIWGELLRQLSLHLVESYSRAKKCTTEGRGLMTLDLSALRSGLEKLAGLKPLPWWDHVLSYVNAFYLPESELLAWVSSHPHYTLAQLQSVAECGCGSGKLKKDRLALLGAVANAHTEAVARTIQDRAAHKLKHQRTQSGVGVGLLAPESVGAVAPAANDAASTASTTVPASASASSSSRLPSAPSSLPTSRAGSKAASRAGSRAPSRPLTPTSASGLAHAHQHTTAAAAAHAAAVLDDDLP